MSFGGFFFKKNEFGIVFAIVIKVALKFNLQAIKIL